MLVFKEKIERYSVLWLLYPCLFALLLYKNRIILNVMCAKDKMIFNDWLHACLIITPLCFCLVPKLASDAVDYRERTFPCFAKLWCTIYLCHFSWLCLKYIIWPIFVFNWIVFENFMKCFRKCETPQGITKSGLESTGPENGY